MAPSRRSRGALIAAALCATAFASPAMDTEKLKLDERQKLPGNPTSPYAPIKGVCLNGGPTLRKANGINAAEAAWMKPRHAKASGSFKKWLAKHGDFPHLDEYPVHGLANGGGGLRSVVVSTGLHKAWDINEKKHYSTSGLYQTVTYEAGLSGSSIFLAAFSSNNWPLASFVEDKIFVPNFANSLQDPTPKQAPTFAEISNDVAAKAAAGYVVTTTDPWGRILAYNSLLGEDAGVKKTITDVVNQSKYKQHMVPMPIYTTLGVENPENGCGLPPPNATQYEFTPYEFGSWNPGVKAFTQSKYLGTTMSSGKPSVPLCTTRYDNMAFVMGTSTQIFNQGFCGKPKGAIINNGIFNAQIKNVIKELSAPLFALAAEAFFTQLPNPFLLSSGSPIVNNATFLNLIDGGESIQVPPIWPFLNRPVDVLTVLDNSADTPDQFPDGRQIHHTYAQAHNSGFGDRMPTIPQPKTLTKANPKHAPIAFGCNAAHDSKKLTIMYIQNKEYSFNTGIAAGKTEYSEKTTRKAIENGIKVATEGGAKDFAFCSGCIYIKRKAEAQGKKLPGGCKACFKKYCYN